MVICPDGNKIAFEKYLRGQDPPLFDLFGMNLDGTDEEALHVQSATDWSSDGITLAGWTYNYYSDSAGRRGDHDLLIFFDENGKTMRRWSQEGNSVRHPIYSSKGDRIAFISTKGAEWQGIYIMRSDCTSDTVLTPKQYVFNQPVAWSPDDKKLLYNAGPAAINMYGKICMIDIRTRQVKDITPFNSDSTYSFAISWRRIR